MNESVSSSMSWEITDKCHVTSGCLNKSRVEILKTEIIRVVVLGITNIQCFRE